MALPKKVDRKFTYSDYCAWTGEERWEIINGEAYDMSPSPSINHQELAGNFFSFLKQKLKGKPCVSFIAPTDVVLSEYDVVQPDVFVVCDPEKIMEANIQGAPDLVIEVLYPSTALKDKKEKKALYEKSGVMEYILVDPAGLYAERFILKSGKFAGPEIFGAKEVFTLSSLEGLEVPLWEIFGEEAPGDVLSN